MAFTSYYEETWMNMLSSDSDAASPPRHASRYLPINRRMSDTAFADAVTSSTEKPILCPRCTFSVCVYHMLGRKTSKNSLVRLGEGGVTAWHQNFHPHQLSRQLVP